MTNHCVILGGFVEPRNARSTGAHRIATVLRESGWRVDVLDHAMQLPPSRLENHLARTVKAETRWIGLSWTWLAGSKEAVEMARGIKRLYPDKLLIVGGQTPYTDDLHADWYVLGYGEEALRAILDHEFGCGPAPKLSPLFGGRYVNAYADYPATPYPSYRVSYDPEDHITSQDVLTLELSRGCRFACKFCSFPFIGMKDDSSVSEEDLYRELSENYQRWGTTVYTIADDTLNDRTSKLLKLRNVVKRLNFTPDFKAFIRLDLLKSHPEQFELLAEARVWMHFYGIETFNHASGKVIGKGQHPDVMKELMLRMREHMLSRLGVYRGSASFIAGLPHESIDSLHATDEWLRANWSDQNVLWWPLQIVRDGDVLSAFGKDMARFGYSEMAEVELPADHFLQVRPTNEVRWKNAHTNVCEVSRLVREFQTRDEALDVFAVARYLPIYKDRQAVLAMRRRAGYRHPELPDYRDRCRRLISEYVTRKLRPIDFGPSSAAACVTCWPSAEQATS